MTSGPLAGIRVLEFAGLGPAPFCGMLMSDLGADVILVDRPGNPSPPPSAVTSRGRCHLPLDLKRAENRDTCLLLADKADILIEGFRPGVMERLGLGPALLLERNPRLVYGRMTGWGQYGPYAARAGHDINYIAISGALHAIGTEAEPIPPLNLVGDFGGGALYLAFGTLAALLHARETGAGQVVDCAISDGTASLMAMLYGYKAADEWKDQRRSNRLDGGAPYYGPYRCADGNWVAIGAIEPQFYALMMDRIGLDAEQLGSPVYQENWSAIGAAITARLATRSAAHWVALTDNDSCLSPILSMTDAPDDPHNRARDTFVQYDGVTQPAPAPRFSKTPGAIQPGASGSAAVEAKLMAWGLESP